MNQIGVSFRYCEDNGGKLLTINDKQMNNWIQIWLENEGVKQIGLGLRRDMYLPIEAWGSINCNIMHSFILIKS